MQPCILFIISQSELSSDIPAALGHLYRFDIVESVDHALENISGNTSQILLFDAGTVTDIQIAQLNRLKVGDQLERPIILITSNCSLDIERHVASIGVFYLLTRPFSMKDIGDLISAALTYRRRTFEWAEGKNELFTRTFFPKLPL